MIATMTADAMTLDPGYQSPAIMREVGSASAFPSYVVERPATQPFRFALVGQDEALAEGFTATLINALTLAVDPGRGLASELAEKARSARASMQAYRTRIETLRTDATLDGFGLSDASEKDFWHFVRSEPFLRKGGLVLVDNGNLRAIWKGEDGSHIGLQFLGNRSVQYVIFRRRGGAAGAISRVAGRDSVEGVKRQIEAFDLRPLLYA